MSVQAELKRVQKRSQAMGEELARELCDLPCTESYGDDEDVVQELTHDR